MATRCCSAHKTVTNFAGYDSITQVEAGGELLRQEQASAWGGFGLHERQAVRIFSEMSRLVCRAAPGCARNPIYLEHAKQEYPAAPALLN